MRYLCYQCFCSNILFEPDSIGVMMYILRLVTRNVKWPVLAIIVGLQFTPAVRFRYLRYRYLRYQPTHNEWSQATVGFKLRQSELQAARGQWRPMREGLIDCWYFQWRLLSHAKAVDLWWFAFGVFTWYKPITCQLLPSAEMYTRLPWTSNNLNNRKLFPFWYLRYGNVSTDRYLRYHF